MRLLPRIPRSLKMETGYARISTSDRDLAPQVNAPTTAGCETIFRETVGGRRQARAARESCNRALRAGDTLIIWRLDRTGRPLGTLIEILQDLSNRSVELVSRYPSGGLAHVACMLSGRQRQMTTTGHA